MLGTRDIQDKQEGASALRRKVKTVKSWSNKCCDSLDEGAWK